MSEVDLKYIDDLREAYKGTGGISHTKSDSFFLHQAAMHMKHLYAQIEMERSITVNMMKQIEIALDHKVVPKGVGFWIDAAVEEIRNLRWNSRYETVSMGCNVEESYCDICGEEIDTILPEDKNLTTTLLMDSRVLGIEECPKGGLHSWWVIVKSMVQGGETKNSISGHFEFEPDVDVEKLLKNERIFDVEFHAYDPIKNIPYVCKLLGVEVKSVEEGADICYFIARGWIHWRETGKNIATCLPDFKKSRVLLPNGEAAPVEMVEKRDDRKTWFFREDPNGMGFANIDGELVALNAEARRALRTITFGELLGMGKDHDTQKDYEEIEEHFSEEEEQ